MRDDVQRLLARTEIVADPELNALYPTKFPARVTVTMNDGRMFTASRDFPKGDPQDPLLPEEIEAKFAGNVSGRFNDNQTRRIIFLVRALGGDAPAKPLLDLLAGREE